MFQVVVNDEEQYSVWPCHRELPAGWQAAGLTGSQDECLAHINEVWKDMRPRSVREALRQAPA
jgi:MbtH protein